MAASAGQGGGMGAAAGRVRAPGGRALLLGLALVWLVLASALGFSQSPQPDPLRPPTFFSPAWWRYPVEREAWLRLPAIGADLRGLHVSADGRLIWAVGTDGTIVHSADGGAQWTLQSFDWADAPAAGEGPPAARPAEAAWWSPIGMAHAGDLPAQQVPQQQQQQQQLAMPVDPGNKGGSDSAVDARAAEERLKQELLAKERAAKVGVSPPPQRRAPAPERPRSPEASVPMAAPPAAVSAPAPAPTVRPGYAADHALQVRRPDLEAVFFLDDGKRGWAVGGAGVVLTTTDGGARWLVSQPLGPEARWLAVCYSPDGQVGWRVTASGKVYRLAAPETVWREVADLGPLQHAVAHGQTGRILALGVDGSRQLGEDGGAWRSLPALAAPANRIVSFDGSVAMFRLADGSMTAQEVVGSLRALPVKSAAPVLAVVGTEAGVFAAGRTGTLLVQDQPGALPRALALGERGALREIRVGADGRGTAVGFNDTPYRSDDGGRLWRPDAARHLLLPAPWLWLAWVLGFAALVVAAARRPVPPDSLVDEQIADSFASDRPLAAAGEDRLDFAPVAWGLSAFLRNEKTEPPLTIAITGDWGTGKSSLMGLLREDLARFGIRSVWFNAWHHQKEEALLAALLSAIRDQAIPSLISLEGLEYRARLLWIRGRRYWPLSMAVAFSVGLIGWAFTHPGGVFANWVTLATDLWGVLVQPPPKPGELDKTLGQFAAGLGAMGVAAGAVLPLISAVLRMRAFGLDPGQLAASLSANAKVRDLGAQASFRQKFAEQFKEVTTALEPRTMLVLIDDLDRCKPEAVLEVMEAVNFLVSSGRVYIVLGMARERVEACVGLAFEKVAREMVEDDDLPADAEATPAGRERAIRREYARQYLEKLINIEVPVPHFDPEASRHLRDEAAPSARPVVPRTLRRLICLWPFVAGALAVGAGAFVAARLSERIVTPPVPQASAPAGPGAPAASAPRGAADSLSADEPAAGPAYFAEARAPESGLPWAAGALGLLALTVLGLALARRPSPVVRDSGAFSDALAIWNPVVAAALHTPRAVKRFQNWVRYLAMRQRATGRAPTLADDLRASLRAMFRRDPAPTPGRSAGDCSPQLVALGALERALPDWAQRGLLAPGGDTPAAPSGLAQAVADALAAHERRFGLAPLQDFVPEFSRLASGVRMGGGAPTREVRADAA